MCGHVHVRFDRSVAGHRIVNPGSVGYALRRGHRRRVLGVSSGRMSSCRETRYARAQFDRALAESGYPHPDYFEAGERR